jgi:hypothetical protein
VAALALLAGAGLVALVLASNPAAGDISPCP